MKISRLFFILLFIFYPIKGNASLEQQYMLGEKIDGAKSIALVTVESVKEIRQPGAMGSDNDLTADYLYSLSVSDHLKYPGKQKPKSKTFLVLQNTERISADRFFRPGGKYMVFLKPAEVAAKYVSRNKLPKVTYHQLWHGKQGRLELADSTIPVYANSVLGYLAAKKSKPRERAGRWAALLEAGPDEIRETALMELSPAPYYPAIRSYIRFLGSENLSTLAAQNILRMSSDSLMPYLDSLMVHKKSKARIVRINLLKVIAPLRQEQVFKHLQKSLKDEDYEVRACAAKGLEGWSDKKAVKSLKKALEDEDDYVRSAACEALVKQGFKIENKEGGMYKITGEPQK
jgi:hypothetical protein